MDESKLKNWYDFIDSKEIKEEYKDELKKYIRKMLDNNGIIIISSQHLAQLVGLKHEEVNKMIISPGSFYRQFTIPKRHGGTRSISAPYPSLLLMQRWIYRNILLPHCEFDNYVTGFVLKRSIKDNASPHCGHNMVLQMDIKDFFPSITLNRVINVFRILGYQYKISYYLAALCCKDGALPQGAPTSPILSNIIAGKMDRRLKGLCDKFFITYTRYADDLTFSGNKINNSFIRLATSIISDEGFCVNQDKTKLLHQNARKIVTGVSISSGRTTIPKSLKRRLRQEAYYIGKYGLKNHMEHNKIRDFKYELRLRGYFAFWKSVDESGCAEKLLHKAFDKTITEKLFISIKNVFRGFKTFSPF